MTQPQQDPVTAARQLSDALNGMAERLDQVKADSEERDDNLKRYGRLNRRLVVVDITLTVLVAAVTWISAHAYDRASQAAESAAQLRGANIAACQQANVTRAENVQLWSKVIGISSANKPPPGQTAAEHARVITEFKAYVAQVFKAKDCSAIFRGH